MNKPQDPPGPAQPRESSLGGQPVLAALEQMCVTVGTGGKIPGHIELMDTLGASERAVRAALRELQDRGRLTRKRGLGTFVADTGGSASKQSRTIVAIARPDRSFFDRCVELLYGYTEHLNLGLMFQPTTETANHNALIASTNDPSFGFLVFGYPLVNLAERLHALGRRTVLVGAPPARKNLEMPCVFNDHKYGGYLVAKHLIGLGHRKIASWQVDRAEYLTEGRRWQGYQRAIAEAALTGISIDWQILRESESWEADPNLSAAYFKNPDAPTALAAWNDSEAARLLVTLMRAGVDVPGRVSITGYDDLPDGLIAFPPLTTVHHGIEQQIDAAVEMLFSGEPLERRQTVIVPNLVERSSTSAPWRRSTSGLRLADKSSSGA